MAHYQNPTDHHIDAFILAVVDVHSKEPGRIIRGNATIKYIKELIPNDVDLLDEYISKHLIFKTTYPIPEKTPVYRNQKLECWNLMRNVKFKLLKYFQYKPELYLVVDKNRSQYIEIHLGDEHYNK